ncbi:OvmZ protein [Streptomyces sp. NPDC048483]|uniref:OvmZ protein n=1 Tax=Streptomyces sp. NPDC048483 TaxID=3154927 RepID=UPI00341B5F05
MAGKPVRTRTRQNLITTVDLLELIELYEECGHALQRTRSGPREKVSGSRAVGISLREEAVNARADLVGVLASWAGTVAEALGTAGPARRDVHDLVRFLADHLDWLLGPATAQDFATEITEITAAARRAAHPEPVLRTALGPCPAPDCHSTLYSEPIGSRTTGRHQVRCDAGHDWPPRQWLLLARAGTSAGRRPQASHTDAVA